MDSPLRFVIGIPALHSQIHREYAMTLKGPRNLIHHPNFFPRNPLVHIRENGRYHPYSVVKKNCGQPCPVFGSAAGTEIDRQLRLLENMARHNFLMIKKGLQIKKLPERFEQKLYQTVLPTLQRIGYDGLIALTLFELTPADWKFMGPVNEKIIVLRPEVNHDISEVLSGLSRNKTGDNENLPRFTGPSLAVLTGAINDNPSPEHLFKLLDRIDLSWITLPRVFRFLERGHSRYLPEYLKTIEHQNSEACLKVFSRITTEFMANFVLKFSDRHHPPDQIEKLLFYGYSALYWKNLRKPPANLENCAVFDHFFNWIRVLARRSKYLESAEARSVFRMKKMKSVVFPGKNINQPQISRWDDSSRFGVTLRHGTIGAVTIFKYFGIDQFLETRQKQGNSPFQSRQNQLQRLLFRIQLNYHSESKKTQGYIKQFIAHLKSAYEISQPAASTPEKRFLYRMITNLQLSLNR